MHVDEAVHAVKFGQLLEQNYYKYNPIEYHGPTLNYFSFLLAWITDTKKLTDVSESDLRIVPAACGMLLILFLFFLKKYLDGNLFVLLIIFTSISSIMVFYNRYYIQESLLVSFTFCFIISLYRYFTSNKKLWVIPAGLFAGLMYSSKETSIITFACVIISIVVIPNVFSELLNFIKNKKRDFLIFIFLFFVTSFLFYSSFLTNWQGPLDSLKTFGNYFSKAGNFPDHIYPWYYYFSLIIFRRIDTLYFSELFTILFFVAGSFFVIKNWKSNLSENVLIKYLFTFTLLLLIIYSAIPYKTPWTMMTYWYGCIIISAFGINETIKKMKGKWRMFFIGFVIAGILHQTWQTYQIVFNYSYHPQNPYVYSQSTKDVELIATRIKEITSSLDEEENTLINITSPAHDYWPLPWYLRSYANISWNEKITNDLYKYPVIVTTPGLESELINKLYSAPPGAIDLYIPLFDQYMEIRPGKEVRGYIKKDIYDRYTNSISKKQF